MLRNLICSIVNIDILWDSYCFNENIFFFQAKWTNKQRVLVIACRGLSFRDRHLMKDMMSLMPHSKTESKMRRGESLFSVNEMAEMKNCNKCLLFEGRRKRDLYMWVSDVARGPSAKFQVENIHTAAELKLTGNCLKGSRPLLSFDMSFSQIHHGVGLLFTLYCTYVLKRKRLIYDSDNLRLVEGTF